MDSPALPLEGCGCSTITLLLHTTVQLFYHTLNPLALPIQGLEWCRWTHCANNDGVRSVQCYLGQYDPHYFSHQGPGYGRCKWTPVIDKTWFSFSDDFFSFNDFITFLYWWYICVFTCIVGEGNSDGALSSLRAASAGERTSDLFVNWTMPTTRNYTGPYQPHITILDQYTAVKAHKVHHLRLSL